MRRQIPTPAHTCRQLFNFLVSCKQTIHWMWTSMTVADRMRTKLLTELSVRREERRESGFERGETMMLGGQGDG